jgi:hypothetical protein
VDIQITRVLSVPLPLVSPADKWEMNSEGDFDDSDTSNASGDNGKLEVIIKSQNNNKKPVTGIYFRLCLCSHRQRTYFSVMSPHHSYGDPLPKVYLK